MQYARAPPGVRPDATTQSTALCLLGRHRVRAEFLYSRRISNKERKTICDSKARR
jgi:hypothetical protein